jgi:hypothetical protein
LGEDLLGRYDVELDLAAHKLNLFAPDHCHGVVYWHASAIAEIPMRVTRYGFLVVSVTLDGKELDAIVSTGTADSLLTDTAAHDLFGLTPESADMTKIGEDSNGVATYRHTFKSLGLSGIAMGNIPIVIYHDVGKIQLEREPEIGTRLAHIDLNNGVSDFVLGMNELRKLHVYLAYGEGVMYATPAETTATSAAKN